MPVQRFRFRFPAEFAALALLRRRFQRFFSASTLDFGQDTRDRLVLALDEAVTNIVRHGYREEGKGAIDVEFADEGGVLVVRLWDDGIFRAAEDIVGLPDGTAGETGMGSQIMRLVMSELSYERTEEGRNLLVMKRHPDSDRW